MASKVRILISGGGFAGLFTALYFDRWYKKFQDAEITVISEENFLLFTPLLHEVATGELDPDDIVSPVRSLLKNVNFFCGSVEFVDLAQNQVTASHGAQRHEHILSYDYLVLALGSEPSFLGLPGLSEFALTMKSVSDASCLRNKMLALLEEADFECLKGLRPRMLSFVVAGGGFAGVETVAAMSDFIISVLPSYRNLKAEDVKLTLVHSGKVLLPELDTKLGIYAGEILSKRGVKICFETRVTEFSGQMVSLSDGSNIETETLIWTAGNAPSKIIQNLPTSLEKHRILVNEFLEVEKWPGVYALGDCAAIPTGSEGKFHPPTAQHAVREAKIVAENILARIEGRASRKFKFRTLGQLASLGRKKGIAQIFGIRFYGFFAWLLWRGVYLSKLPRLEKKIRVLLRWSLGLVFGNDRSQLPANKTNWRGTKNSEK